jgi:hypothetical protein
LDTFQDRQASERIRDPDGVLACPRQERTGLPAHLKTVAHGPFRCKMDLVTVTGGQIRELAERPDRVLCERSILPLHCPDVTGVSVEEARTPEKSQ